MRANATRVRASVSVLLLSPASRRYAASGRSRRRGAAPGLMGRLRRARLLRADLCPCECATRSRRGPGCSAPRPGGGLRPTPPRSSCAGRPARPGVSPCSYTRGIARARSAAAGLVAARNGTVPVRACKPVSVPLRTSSPPFLYRPGPPLPAADADLGRWVGGPSGRTQCARVRKDHPHSGAAHAARARPSVAPLGQRALRGILDRRHATPPARPLRAPKHRTRSRTMPNRPASVEETSTVRDGPVSRALCAVDLPPQP